MWICPKLNKFVRRERYPSMTPTEAVADISQAKAQYFTMFDALKGYHQCPLNVESQKPTTFITLFVSECTIRNFLDQQTLEQKNR